MKKIFLLFIIFLFFYSSGASAVMRAVFPNANTLQPMPVNVSPNVSGNINSHVNQGALPSENLPNSGSNLNSNNLAPRNISYSYNLGLVILLIIIVFFIALILFVILWKKKIVV